MQHLAHLKLLAPLLLLVLAGPQPEAGEDDPLEALRWLGGHWAVDAQTGYAEELWMPPRGGLMLGLNRTVKEGRGANFETMRIESRKDGIYYVASPSGGPSTDFKLVESAEHRAVFANPEHDFPKRIVYERDGAELKAWAEGDPGQVLAFSWKRVADVQ